MRSSAAAVTAPNEHDEPRVSSVLLATAGDDETSGAVRAAAWLSKRLGATVEVLAVVPPFPHAVPTGLLMATAAEIDEESRKSTVDRVRAQLSAIRGTGAWPVRTATGWPADAILTAAERWHASLIVMGVGKHSLLARLFGSETAVSVAKQTATPLLAVPEGCVRSPANAFVAIDFTPSSIAAAHLAAQLIPLSGSVTLVHTSIFANPAGEAGSVNDIYATGASNRLDGIAKDVESATHRRVKTMLADGAVADVMTSAAAATRGDLIVVGSRERDLVDRLIIGSVRTQVLRRSACPVLVFPQRAEDGK